MACNGLTKHQLELIVEAVMRENRKQVKKTEKTKKDNRLFNTRLIVYNFRELEAHCATIPEQIVEFEESMFDEEKLSLEVLMQERAKTYAMMHYVKLMWQAYEKHAKKVDGVYLRRFKILNSLYVDSNILSVESLSELYHVSIPLIYKDRGIAINNFSVFLFGLEALSLKGS